VSVVVIAGTAGSEERAELYRSLPADKQALVVLDNAAIAGQVRPLLPGTSGCLTVVTSRHRLSRPAVRDGAHRITLDVLTEQESAALVAAATRGYRTGNDPAQIAELARLCARLPLALRIAAERAPHPPPARTGCPAARRIDPVGGAVPDFSLQAATLAGQEPHEAHGLLDLLTGAHLIQATAVPSTSSLSCAPWPGPCWPTRTASTTRPSTTTACSWA
jgi:hypothetical protein